LGGEIIFWEAIALPRPSVVMSLYWDVIEHHLPSTEKDNKTNIISDKIRLNAAIQGKS